MYTKKILLFGILLLLLFTILMPKPVLAWKIGDPIVPQTCGVKCDDKGTCTGEPCGLAEFFTLLGNIYSFIVLEIATPLAVVAIAAGGALMMVSAGNPGRMELGKKILYAAIIGLVLVFCSWLIIDFILKALGYTGNWSTIGGT